MAGIITDEEFAPGFSTAEKKRPRVGTSLILGHESVGRMASKQIEVLGIGACVLRTPPDIYTLSRNIRCVAKWRLS